MHLHTFAYVCIQLACNCGHLHTIYIQFCMQILCVCMRLHRFAYICIQFVCICIRLHTCAYNLHTICMQFACVCMRLHTFAYICIRFACICIRLHTFACMFANCLQSSGTRLSSFLIPSGRILGRASATGPHRNCLTAAMRKRHM